jgi:hypothetical protein
MTTIIMDHAGSDEARRKLLFDGEILVFSPRPSVTALVDFARSLIREAFGDLDPENAQHVLPVEQFVAVLTALKPKFINHPTSKELVRGILAELGCDLERTYFDVPRMRTATADAYLTSGIAYAFHPHRDTWYSAPVNQINFWLPIYDLEPNNSMAFHPQYWANVIANESEEFDYYEYVRTARKDAAKHVKADTRKQPHATEPVAAAPDLRVITPVGGVMLFSAAHLHSTVPNTTNKTRFSIDFRTAHLDDVISRAGAKNVDSRCRGTALRDFLRGSDLQPFAENLVLPYENTADFLQTG